MREKRLTICIAKMANLSQYCTLYKSRNDEMKSYRELIEQTFEFPQEEFKVWEHELLFNDVPLMDIIRQYGTPLKLTYLPRISENIRFTQATFNKAIEK